MLIPVNITGETYKSRSKQLSNQFTQNFYSEINENPAVRSKYVLQPFPGMVLFGTATGADRGMLEHNGLLYKVSGTTLYSVSESGTHTELGTIAGTGRCVLDGIGSSVVVVTQGTVYVWNGSTLTEVVDADLESPNACAHINNQIIYDGDGGRFASSDVGDATAIDGLNYATAESNADVLIRPYTFDQIVYLFGAKTTEPWWNSGVGSPPFDKLETGIIEIGLGALHSVSHNINFMYFLGHDQHIYRVKGAQAEKISNVAIHHDLTELQPHSNAVGFCFTIEGQNFYLLTLLAKSFLFSETTGWHHLSSGNSGGRTYANSYAYIYGKHLVADYRNGNIYEWDLEAYTDNEDPIIRIRDTGVLHAGLFGKPERPVTINHFQLIMEVGVGTLSGQGEDPKIMLSISDDGGRTFGTEVWASIGKSGQFLHEVRWDNLGQYYNPMFRIKISDPVFCSIHSAAADIEIGI